MITLVQLEKIYSSTSPAVLTRYLDAINATAEEYSLVTKLRLSMFLAQIGVESMNLNAVTENLNYSAIGLCKTFSKYFPTMILANKYARKPQSIANRVYASRMGNGDELSGDGWKFRGRGAIQITGHDNYEALRSFMKHTSIDKTIAWLEAPEGIIGSAGWYWNERKLNAWADRGDVKMVTHFINGGYNGLAERQALYNKALTVL